VCKTKLDNFFIIKHSQG